MNPQSQLPIDPVVSSSLEPNNLVPDIEPVATNNGPNKGIIAILLGIILVLVVIAGYMLFFRDKTVSTLGINGQTIHVANTASAVQAQFMTDIFSSNIKGAYDLTSNSFKKSTTESNFANLEKYIEVSKLSTSGVNEKAGTKSTVINGTISSNGVHIFGYSSRMIKQSGIWKVDNIVIQY